MHYTNARKVMVVLLRYGATNAEPSSLQLPRAHRLVPISHQWLVLADCRGCQKSTGFIRKLLPAHPKMSVNVQTEWFYVANSHTWAFKVSFNSCHTLKLVLFKWGKMSWTHTPCYLHLNEKSKCWQSKEKNLKAVSDTEEVADNL